MSSLCAHNLIFPEIYLNYEPEKRIARINKAMCEYLSGSILKDMQTSDSGNAYIVVKGAKSQNPFKAKEII